MTKPSKPKLREFGLHNPGAPKCKLADYKQSKYRVLPAGDTAVSVELGEAVDRTVSAAVLALARRLDEKRLKGIIESVPTLLPVCYDRRFGPDLDAVAARSALTPAQVIERHSAFAHHVYMLGFLPGQAYMGDLPVELVLPRRESPRLRVAPGSLAIATTMTCIFPLETPCGWHVIGRSPVALWENGPPPRALLAPGDKVTFEPVSLREYEDLRRNRAAAGAGGTAARPIGAAA